MNPVTERAARRIIYTCPCRQCRLVAVRVEGKDGRAWASFRATAAARGVVRGQTLTACPGCGRDISHVPWDAFTDEVFAGH